MPRNYFILFALALITCCSVMVIPVPAMTTASQSSGDGALTRGSSFAITITGRPNTPYYIWDARTFSMSGKPGDQPPVIISYQSDIQKDPADGPFVIGSYQYSGGGGRTIREDVAPSSDNMSNTNYYAQVTTDSNGIAIVGFRTSSSTATRTFSVKVENPHNPNDAAFTVQRGTLTTKPGSVFIGAVTTVPLPSTTVPTPVPPLTTPTPEISVPRTLPMTTSTMTPAQKMPSGLVWAFVTLGAGILAMRNR